MSLRQAQSAFSAVKWLTISNYITFVASFFNSILITRGLGPDTYGVYSYLIWMVAISMAVTVGGLNITAIKFIAEAMGRQNVPLAHGLYAWLRRLAWIGLAIMSAVLVVTAFFPGIYPLPIAQKIWIYIGFVLAGSITKAIFMFEMSVSKGYSIFTTEAIAACTIGIGSLIASGVLYMLGLGLNAYLALFLVASALHPLIAITMMRRYGIKPEREPIPTEIEGRLHNSLRWNFSFSLANLLSTKSVDTYLLGLYAATAYVGYYNIAGMLTKSGLDLLSTGFSSMLLTFISRASTSGGPEKVQHIFRVSVRFYQYMGILVAGVGYLMSERLIMVLYGARYLEAVPALQVMVMVGGICLPSAAYGALFIASDHYTARLRYVVTNAVISCVSSLVFIPWLGFNGALISALVGNVLAYTVVGIVAYRNLGISFPFRRIALQWLSAGLAFAIVMLLLHDKSSLARSLASSIVFTALYTIFSLNLQAWEAGDIQLIAKNIPAFGRLSKFLMLRKPPESSG